MRTSAGADRTEIWTYAGQNVNASLSNGLSHTAGKTATADNFRLRINEVVSADLVHQWFSAMRKLGPLPPAIRDLSALLERLKFRQCLPDELAEQMLLLRAMPGPEGMVPLEESILFVHFKSNGRS
jgi:hypothetical protein